MWHQLGSFTADCDRESFQADLVSLSFFCVHVQALARMQMGLNRECVQG